MKDRLYTLIGGLVSLLIVLVLLLPPSQPKLKGVSRPTSIDRGQYGLAGLKTWLDKSAIKTHSLRRRYQYLMQDESLPSSGNLLILSLPQSEPAMNKEVEDLYAWLLAGNNAFILLAKNDRPEWSYLNFDGSAKQSEQALLARLGFVLFLQDQPEQDTDRELEDGDNGKSIIQSIEIARHSLQRQPVILTPNIDHRRLMQVESIMSYAMPSNSELVWEFKPEPVSRLSLPLFINQETLSPVLWEIRVGNNSVWLSTYPDLFGNVSLANHGNARLIANIIDDSLGPEGTVIFDDFHFGLSDLYDPDAFFSDKRLHNTLLFILFFWLIYLVGRSNRLISPKPVKKFPRASDFVEAMAGFLAGHLSNKAVAKGLIEHFFNELRVQSHLPENGQPVWECINKPAVAAHDIDRLKYYIKNLTGRRSIDINQVSKTLNNIRKSLR